MRFTWRIGERLNPSPHAAHGLVSAERDRQDSKHTRKADRLQPLSASAAHLATTRRGISVKANPLLAGRSVSSPICIEEYDLSGPT